MENLEQQPDSSKNIPAKTPSIEEILGEQKEKSWQEKEKNWFLALRLINSCFRPHL